MSIWQEWTTTNNKLKKLKKTKMINVNTKTTNQKIFNIKILIMIRLFIRKNWMGYCKIMKETQIFVRRKIKRIMKMQKKKMTLRI